MMQEVSAIIPNDAKAGGRVSVFSDEIEIERLETTPLPCNMLQASSSYLFQLAANKACR